MPSVATLKALCADLPACERWSLRYVESSEFVFQVRQGVVQPPRVRHDSGAFLSVFDGTGGGYAATCDVSPSGIRTAAEQALRWAHFLAHRHLACPVAPDSPIDSGQAREHGSHETVSGKVLVPLLTKLARDLKCHPRIVDWSAGLHLRFQRTVLLSSTGSMLEQRCSDLTPDLYAVASRASEVQRRSFGHDYARQGGLEQLEALAVSAAAPRVAEEALRLVEAPDCPSASMDLVLLPGQMVLQIHESIGHPLELDRILGDERNYAGGSFVTPEMFGRYRYGSALLNVSFDPFRPQQMASYAYDDDGIRAERRMLIRAGVLERALGGAVSQRRSGIAGVACARAERWNRPPIDRMANLNLEPGTSSLAEIIGRVENGVMMETNRSWSIDDRRNKFQFGCECGWLIRDGQVRGLVKNPGYRGISATFWRSLGAVGDNGTLRVMGLGSCGKGEPNQTMHVGHAAPACLFTGVEVFGRA
ncbi:MAG: TldD/PmbA family protein [Gammaproteobacteria bacterium]